MDELFEKTVDDWARFYADPKPATLNSQNLVSRRFALEIIETGITPSLSDVLLCHRHQRDPPAYTHRIRGAPC